MKNTVLYIHGKGGGASESEHYKPLFPCCDVIGLDYKTFSPWKTEKRVWKAYDTLYVDGEDFEQIGAAFEETHDVKKAVLGNAALRLMKQRELVDFAVRWIEKNRK